LFAQPEAERASFPIVWIVVAVLLAAAILVVILL
jgi:hypothetical protein